MIVPTYNEADNIPMLAAGLAGAVPEAHLYLMDDNSPDGTADVAEKLFAAHREFAQYRVIRREGKRGLGRAYRDGFRRALDAGYERIVQMDADLSHDPKYLPQMLAERADLVIGSRYCPGGGVENWPRHRLWLSRFAVWYVRTIAQIPVADSTAGYRCWTRRALEAVQLDTLHSDGYSFQVEMTHRALRAGMSIAEVPIVFTDRRFGRSKISRTVLFESFLMPWRLRLHPWTPTQAVVRTFAESSKETMIRRGN